MVRYALAGDMLGELSRSWWVVVLRGVAAVLFGLLAIFWPGESLVALVVIFGVFALVDGVVLAFAAYRGPVLPDSTSPRVSEVRESVRLALREALIPEAGVDVLSNTSCQAAI